ncbi:MAG: lysine--tRNA ligase [Nitrososphaeraceae archaeon]
MKTDGNILGKGTWIDKIAHDLISRENKLGRDTKLIRVESGLGASGIPHIGSMGDAVRAYGVTLALQNLGYESELIAYSDDMDGLRKIPSGLPDSLHKEIAKPVSEVSDPFGDCHASYGAHMSSLLLEGLDRVGVRYKFQSGTAAYKNNMLSKQIDTILRNSNRLGIGIQAMIGQDKYNQTLPYFPICQNCHRLYVAKAEKYFPEEMKVAYSCLDTRIGNDTIKGCRYVGESNINNGNGKLAWKVEFAARWQAFDIRFEAYGKDIMDSVKVNDWVSSDILGYSHPLHLRYEMFLDKVGKKISKSKGNVLTPQMWLEYGTPESLLLLLYKRVTGTRHVSIDDIPSLMDEYDFYEDVFFGNAVEENQIKLAKIRGIYEYINHLKPSSSPSKHVPYRLLVQQALLFSDDAERIDRIYGRLAKYGIAAEKNAIMTNKIRLASNWADDQGLQNDRRSELDLTQKDKDALRELIQALREFKGKENNNDSPKILQSRIFDISRRNEVGIKEFFTILYRILVGADRGPRIGNYVLDLGIDRTCDLVHAYL